ncbi:MAG: YtxH domain-containing protein [Cryomorphaceae bacterium]|nr:YtxH domain-containing protein [Cryomorphaceae bacterium]
MGKSDNNSEKMVAALLIGAAISGAAAILFAPNKGSTTRKKLFAKGEKVKNNLQEKYDDVLKNSKKEVAEKVKS